MALQTDEQQATLQIAAGKAEELYRNNELDNDAELKHFAWWVIFELVEKYGTTWEDEQQNKNIKQIIDAIHDNVLDVNDYYRAVDANENINDALLAALKAINRSAPIAQPVNPIQHTEDTPGAATAPPSDFTYTFQHAAFNHILERLKSKGHSQNTTGGDDQDAKFSKFWQGLAALASKAQAAVTTGSALAAGAFHLLAPDTTQPAPLSATLLEWRGAAPSPQAAGDRWALLAHALQQPAQSVTPSAPLLPAENVVAAANAANAADHASADDAAQAQAAAKKAAADAAAALQAADDTLFANPLYANQATAEAAVRNKTLQATMFVKKVGESDEEYKEFIYELVKHHVKAVAEAART